MPKHIVTAIGLIVSLGVIALAVVLVALPVYLQAVGVDGQTAAVADTNATYEAELDALDAQKDDLDAVDAQVAALRAQIPDTGQLDDVFDLVVRAAAASGVVISSVAAGDPVAFESRSGEAASGEAASPSATPGGADAGAAAGTPPEQTPSADPDDPPTGRQQIDVTITAVAGDIAQSTAFLDALRAGPRLLSSMVVSSQAGESGIDVRVSAVTYLDAEG